MEPVCTKLMHLNGKSLLAHWIQEALVPVWDQGAIKHSALARMDKLSREGSLEERVVSFLLMELKLIEVDSDVKQIYVNFKNNIYL